MTYKIAAIVVSAILAAASAGAAPADHYTAGDLLKTAQGLQVKAAGTGSASEKLATYPNHFTMLAYRNQDGTAEIHQQFADVFYVVRGKATLITEGTLAGSKEENPGELRGTGIEGGKTIALKRGDIVHIPAGTPHQLLIAKGKRFVYFVVKVKEN
jgi:mannose-6-phosphate isomerase-like protein (cupin superfamily)